MCNQYFFDNCIHCYNFEILNLFDNCIHCYNVDILNLFDNCIHCYNVDILNLKLQWINTEAMIEKIKSFVKGAEKV